MESTIKSVLEDSIKCRKCGNVIKNRKCDLQDVMIFETVPPLHDPSTQDLPIALGDIPLYLNLKEKLYCCRGLVSFIPPVTKYKDAVGHYIAYTYREASQNWEKYDDLQSKCASVRRNTKVIVQFIIYTYN